MAHRTGNTGSNGRGAEDGAVEAPPRLVFAFLLLGVITGAVIAPGERGPLGDALAEAVGLADDRAVEETSALVHRLSADDTTENANRDDL